MARHFSEQICCAPFLQAGQLVDRLGDKCLDLMSELFTKFGDSLTYRGNDYQKTILTQKRTGVFPPMKYQKSA